MGPHAGLAPEVVGSEMEALSVVSACISFFSLLSTIFAFYWFVRMRRSFRHDLIMLLIQSDFIKSLPFVTYPLVTLARGGVGSDTAFCQAMGFILAVGIEASDVAVLLIALHSAIYIFFPRRSSGENGLYPYRRVAYAFYIIFPLGMASLAFARGVPGYVNTGEYCYLPTDPSWYRLGLSWIPRYVNFFIILLIYTCIYLRVRVLMRRYSRRSSMAPSSLGGSRRRASAAPPVPPLAIHGLLPSSPPSRQSTTGSRHRSVSSGSMNSTSPFVLEGAGRHAGTRFTTPRWNVPGAQHGTPTRHDRQDADVAPDARPSVVSVAEPPAALVQASKPSLVEADIYPASRASTSTANLDDARAFSFYHRRPSERDDAVASSGRPLLRPARTLSSGIRALLRRGPTATPSSSTISLAPGAVDHSNMAATRDRIRRQLRLLFVYPVVYLIIWTFPFVADAGRWSGRAGGGRSSPFWLLVLSLASLCIQGAADSLLFTARERPWRHARAGFVEGLGRRAGARRHYAPRHRPRVGRTREEMLGEERMARERREEELAWERRVAREMGPPPLRRPAGEVNWWDVELASEGGDAAAAGAGRGGPWWGGEDGAESDGAPAPDPGWRRRRSEDTRAVMGRARAAQVPPLPRRERLRRGTWA